MQVGPSLVGENAKRFSGKLCCSNDAKGCAEPAGGQRTGVAVSEHAAAVGKERLSMGTDSLAARDVVGVNLLGESRK